MIRKHSVTIRGHRTSVSLEDEFWDSLGVIADRNNQTIASLIAQIDHTRPPEDNLSSAARVYVLHWLSSKSEFPADDPAQ